MKDIPKEAWSPEILSLPAHRRAGDRESEAITSETFQTRGWRIYEKIKPNAVFMTQK
jgi:hypothetical protein